ncbi:hypothetical protein FPQ18DRAFT_306753 [Pyronema domesticum]|nr:hypothetical protein FPQ18DRAFT_306753 [Pyronema domesticum]
MSLWRIGPSRLGGTFEEEAKGAKDNAATEPKKSDTEEDDGLDADESATKSKNSTRVVKIWFHKTGSEVKKTNEASKEVKEMLEKLKPNLTMRPETFRLRPGLNMPKPIEKEREKKKGAVTEKASSETAGNITDNTVPKAATTGNTASDTPPAEKTEEEKAKLEKDTAGKGTNLSTPSKSNKPDIKSGEDVDVDELLSTAPAKPNAIPYFIVTDKSSVNVVSVTHEFQELMASNRFDSTSVEASVSGGAFGWSAAASAGAKNDNESAESSSKKTYGKFPRVTVYLNPDDLEPTDDLKEALKIKHLRKLHETYGHLFCHQVELGGCLETSKVVQADATTSESSEKHQFKAEVGVAVSSPYGIGGSMKASHERGNQTAQGTNTQNQSEAMSFDATGGNTLLAANPPAWTASVMDFNNWRVIERSKLTPLADAIAGNPKYSGVKQWFIQAVPKLSEYLTVTDSRTVDVRFKVVLDDSLTRVLRKTVEVEDKDAMFFPASTQAPVIASGTRSDTDRSRVVWTIEVPTGNSVGILALIQTCFADLSVIIVNRPQLPYENKHEVALTMGVYRNQQGVYLPAMSSSDEHSLWRILKYDDSKNGDQIKDGERVRLCCKFSDQTGGFRDFHEDSYGRRRFTKPKDMATDSLYLKLPYPGFQNLKSEFGSSMVLSPDDKKVPVVQNINLLKRDTDGKTIVPGQNSYSLFDLSFRLDSVDNNGEGDALDFMNSADRAAHTSTEKSLAPEPGSPQDILTALIYGANMRL